MRVYESPHPPEVFVSFKLISISVSQLSVAVGLTAEGIASHSTVKSDGTPTKTGGVLSDTIIVCVPTALFPHSSVAIQVLVIL